MKIKICGVTHPDDAEYASRMGADYIGMIFSDCSKRKVPLLLAKSIADAAKKEGAEPVGVFVDETAEQILSICEQTGIRVIQLHGTLSRQALYALPEAYSIIYAHAVAENRSIDQEQGLPSRVVPLYDNTKGGTGSPFDWSTFSPPKDRHWFLAGGLNPNNVAKAIALLKPHGVDVATGVEFSDRIRKDPPLVKAFIQAAKQVKETR